MNIYIERVRGMNRFGEELSKKKRGREIYIAKPGQTVHKTTTGRLRVFR